MSLAYKLSHRRFTTWPKHQRNISYAVHAFIGTIYTRQLSSLKEHKHL